MSKPFTFTGAYDHPNTCTGCGSWSFTSQEWAAAGFEEGLATFAGDVAMYWFFAPQPTTCLSSSSCGIASQHIENSGGSSCAAGNERHPINVDRYLWDIYDSIDDPGFVDTTAINYWQFFAIMNAYPSGTSNHQIDEPWNAAFTAVDNFDGRGSSDFEFRLNNLYTIDSSVLRSNNCGSI